MRLQVGQADLYEGLIVIDVDYLCLLLQVLVLGCAAPADIGYCTANH